MGAEAGAGDSSDPGFGEQLVLEAARVQGDALNVGINSDRSEHEIKGPGRPILPEAERAELVAAMEAVNAVVFFDESTTPRCFQFRLSFGNAYLESIRKSTTE